MLDNCRNCYLSNCRSRRSNLLWAYIFLLLRDNLLRSSNKPSFGYTLCSVLDMRCKRLALIIHESNKQRSQEWHYCTEPEHFCLDKCPEFARRKLRCCDWVDIRFGTKSNHLYSKYTIVLLKGPERSSNHSFGWLKSKACNKGNQSFRMRGRIAGLSTRDGIPSHPKHIHRHNKCRRPQLHLLNSKDKMIKLHNLGKHHY